MAIGKADSHPLPRNHPTSNTLFLKYSILRKEYTYTYSHPIPNNPYPPPSTYPEKSTTMHKVQSARNPTKPQNAKEQKNNAVILSKPVRQSPYCVLRVLPFSREKIKRYATTESNTLIPLVIEKFYYLIFCRAIPPPLIHFIFTPYPSLHPFPPKD